MSSPVLNDKQRRPKQVEELEDENEQALAKVMQKERENAMAKDSNENLEGILERADNLEARFRDSENVSLEHQEKLCEEFFMMEVRSEHEFMEVMEIQKEKGRLISRAEELRTSRKEISELLEIETRGEYSGYYFRNAERAAQARPSTKVSRDTALPQSYQTAPAEPPAPIWPPIVSSDLKFIFDEPRRGQKQIKRPTPKLSRKAGSGAGSLLNVSAVAWAQPCTAGEPTLNGARQIQGATQEEKWTEYIPPIKLLEDLNKERKEWEYLPVLLVLTLGNQKGSKMTIEAFTRLYRKQAGIKGIGDSIKGDRKDMEKKEAVIDKLKLEFQGDVVSNVSAKDRVWLMEKLRRHLKEGQLLNAVRYIKFDWEGYRQAYPGTRLDSKQYEKP